MNQKPNEAHRQPRYVKNARGENLAFHQLHGRSPGIVFCGGFMSDMTGTKAMALEQYCIESNLAFVRFDYSGHGQSEGKFEDGTISSWLADALTIIDTQTRGPQILVGSSMGGWISLLIAQQRREIITALALIAPAADFTEEIYWQELNDTQRQGLNSTGQFSRPSEYSDEPYLITKALIEDGKKHLLLQKQSIDIQCPVRIFHGMRDDAVPWQNSLFLANKLKTEDLLICYRKEGDHRLSEAEDIDRLCRELTELIPNQKID